MDRRAHGISETYTLNCEEPLTRGSDTAGILKGTLEGENRELFAVLDDDAELDACLLTSPTVESSAWTDSG